LLWLQQDPKLVLWKGIFVDPVLTGSLTGLWSSSPCGHVNASQTEQIRVNSGKDRRGKAVAVITARSRQHFRRDRNRMWCSAIDERITREKTVTDLPKLISPSFVLFLAMYGFRYSASVNTISGIARLPVRSTRNFLFITYTIRDRWITDELIFEWMLSGLSTTKLLLIPCRQTEALISLETQITT